MNKKTIASLLIAAAFLQGCTAAAVVAVAGGAAIASDNRSVGKQVDDQKIEFNAHAALSKHKGIADNTNLQVVSMNGKALVVGQAPNTFLRDEAIKIINQVEEVKFVYDQIRVSNKTSISTRTNDVWLTSKVKTALFRSEKLDAMNVKVVTENGEVFLLGLVYENEAKAAVEIARHVGGVNRVFKMFEIIE